MVGGRAAELSPKTDQFMLGAVLHFVMTGRAPYGGKTVEAVLAQAYRCEPQEYDRATSAELVAVVRRAMARDPEERFESVSEFRRALDDFLSHESSRALEQRARGRLQSIEEMICKEEVNLTEGAVFRKLGEARFGFRAALDAWEGNREAREGLQKLLELGVQWGLSEGAPETAQIFLNELPDERPDLRQRVEQVNQWFADRQVEGLFFEQSPNAQAVVGADGRIEYANRRLGQLFGYTIAELIDKPVEELLPQRFRQSHASLRRGFIQDASERPMGEDLDLVGLAADGSEFPVDIQLSPVRSEGEPMVIASVTRLEEEPGSSLPVLSSRTVLRQFPMPLLVEGRGEIWYINKAAVEALGYESRNDLLGRPLEEVIASEALDDVDELMQGRVQTAEGEWKPATIRVDPIEHNVDDGTRYSARLMTIEFEGE
jgi:PAS domain S-box-containing protein